MTLASWDLETGQRIRRHVGHEEIINCLDISKRGQELLVSASDDGCIGIWDPRQKHAIEYLETELPITAVALSEAGNEIYSGGIDNTIHVWDLRKKSVVYSMAGHTDTITSLQISPDSQTLLSNSHDSTVRTWNIRPFAPTNRHIRTYDGAPMGLEKNLIRASWDPKGEKIAAGSGDRSVVVWDFRTGKLLYKLPGHKGTVNDVRFSPNSEPISESHRIRIMPSPLANPVAQLYLDRRTGRSCLVSLESKNDSLLESKDILYFLLDYAHDLLLSVMRRMSPLQVVSSFERLTLKSYYRDRRKLLLSSAIWQALPLIGRAINRKIFTSRSPFLDSRRRVEFKAWKAWQGAERHQRARHFVSHRWLLRTRTGMLVLITSANVESISI